MIPPTTQSLEIQETVKQVIEDAIEKKRIKKQINAVDRELDNIFVFRDVLGIRYIPAKSFINNSPIKQESEGYEKAKKALNRLRERN